MGDGKTKPIDQIKVGDKISNALPGDDPDTAKQVHTVTAIHVTHTDHDDTDITVATPTGPQTVTGTSHHLYWDATARARIRADHLHIGDHLQTTGQASTTPVLVHNAGPCGITIWLAIHDDPLLVKAAEKAGKNQIVQRDLDAMQGRLAEGNLNPGIGNGFLSDTDFAYARSRNGARLFFRNTEGGIRIAGKADKGNEPAVIAGLKSIYGQ